MKIQRSFGLILLLLSCCSLFSKNSEVEEHAVFDRCANTFFSLTHKNSNVAQKVKLVSTSKIDKSGTISCESSKGVKLQLLAHANTSLFAHLPQFSGNLKNSLIRVSKKKSFIGLFSSMVFLTPQLRLVKLQRGDFSKNYLVDFSSHLENNAMLYSYKVEAFADFYKGNLTSNQSRKTDTKFENDQKI